MNLNLIGHDAPINKQASTVFWKAPWWARYPEEAKPALWTLKQKEHSWEAWIDYTKPPAVGAKDFRGHKFTIHGEPVVVIGYSRPYKERTRLRRGKRPPWWIGDGWDDNRLNATSEKVHAWWATFRGEIIEVYRLRGDKKSWRRCHGVD